MLSMLQRTVFYDKMQIDINNAGNKRDAEKLHFKCEIVFRNMLSNLFHQFKNIRKYDEW